MMRRSLALLMTLVVLHGSTAGLLARPAQMRATWAELPPLIQGRTIEMTLPDSTRVRAIAVEVRRDTLLMDVRRTSNPGMHPKGRAEILREDVTALEVFYRRRPGEPTPGAIGAAAGAVAVSPLMFYIGETGRPNALAVVVLIAGVVGGSMIANYLYSRTHDNRRDVLITVER